MSLDANWTWYRSKHKIRRLCVKMLSMRHCFSATICFGISISTACADLGSMTPEPIEKNGSCPSNYVASGKYCAPTLAARFAVNKLGPCPSNYVSSGNYCLALNGAKYVVPKTGSCPSGWVASANYCMKQRN